MSCIICLQILLHILVLLHSIHRCGRRSAAVVLREEPAMKKAVALLLSAILLLGICPAVHAEEEKVLPPVMPGFTLDTSALPFADIQWDVKVNNLAKALDVKAEKAGKNSILNSTVSIDGFGEGLPVVYTFRNNKLASVRVMIRPDYGSDSGFFEKAEGKQLRNYIERFIGAHPSHTYASETAGYQYTVTDVTEMSYGVMQNGNTLDLAIEFFPAQKYDTSALEKNKKIEKKASDNGSVVFYDSDPFLFTHDLTSKANRFSYSCFQWYIMMYNAGKTPGRMPALYFSFTYCGTDDSSGVKQLRFTVDDEIFTFALRSPEIGKLEQTAFGELRQTFTFRIDGGNYAFLEKLAKCKKAKLTMKGRAGLGFSFLLFIDLNGRIRQKLIEGMKNYEKVCGLTDGPLAFGRFSGTPMTIE